MMLMCVRVCGRKDGGRGDEPLQGRHSLLKRETGGTIAAETNSTTPERDFIEDESVILQRLNLLFDG